ncbi:kinase-like domain-containing protein [Xylariales sp. PMI_506]|nr:kinase-like domain-containing protein [Xylariales sp. PMI_506]
MAPFPIGMFNSAEPVPLITDDITAAWLSKVLGVKVEAVKINRIMHNTSSKVLIGVEYGADVTTEIPTRLVEMKATYRREAEFYYYIAPTTDMNIPEPWYCGTDTVNGQGIVIMSDLTVDDVAIGEVLKTWGCTGSEHDFLAAENMGGLNYARQFGQGRGPPVSEQLRDRESVLAAWRTLWKTSDPRFRCFVHGDCHIGQTYITADGQPGLLDWQGAHINSALHDVSFFINGILSIEDRRANDKQIFQHYLDSLHKSGGPEIAFDDIWPEYRKHTLHGFLWALTPPEMQPAEQTHEISTRYSAAIIDNKTIELLESLPEYTKT